MRRRFRSIRISIKRCRRASQPIQIAIILAICFVGHVFSILIPLGIPSSVISMVLLFALFAAKVLKRDALDQAGDFMLQHMAIFMIHRRRLYYGVHSARLPASLRRSFLICLISSDYDLCRHSIYGQKKLVCLLQRRIKRHV